MARSTHTRITDAPRDAIALLKQDHRTVDALFKEFESADEDQQLSLAEHACRLLMVHAQIEEEILYPSASEALEDEEELELVREAAVEHASVRDVIAKIEDMDAGDEAFHATVTVLGEYVRHHVKEEEDELFPKLKKTDLDLKAMGRQLAERKLALMEDMGIEADVSAPARKRPTRTRKSAARAHRKPAARGSAHTRTARH